MKFVFSAVVFLISYAVSFAQSIPEKINAYLVAAEKAEIFNGSILVASNGNILVNKGVGFRNVETKVLNDENTTYQIGSVTKQFTAAVILKLAEQKKLALSDKLNKYFPQFANGDKITIEHLLTHTSGIFNYTNDVQFMATGSDKPANEQSMMALFKDKPLDFEPGVKFNYSNSGYSLLGYIAEKVTGKKYEQLIRTMIFKPLGMTHSGFDFTNLRTSDKAIGYYTIAGDIKKAKIVDSSVSYAAGSIYSTTGDIYKWNQSLSSGKILRKSSIQNAFKPRLSHYGLGVVIDSIYGKVLISHSGGIDGFVSYNAIMPVDKISITLLSNVATSQTGKMGRDILAILSNQPYTLPQPPVVRKEVTVDTAILNQYAGEYEITPQFHITVRVVNGLLKAEATGQQEFTLFAEKENFFFLKVVKAEVEFVKGTDGKIEKLILYQNGLQLPGKKIR